MSSEKVALGALSPGGAPRLATPLVLVFNSSDEWMAAALSELQSVPSRRHLGRVSAGVYCLCRFYSYRFNRSFALSISVRSRVCVVIKHCFMLKVNRMGFAYAYRVLLQEV